MNHKTFMYWTIACVFGLTYRVFTSEPQTSTKRATKEIENVARRIM